MNFTVKYPAFVVGTKKGGRIKRPMVVLAEGNFSFLEISVDDAPLAFRTSSSSCVDEVNCEIRLFDSKLYQRNLSKKVSVEDQLEFIKQDPLDNQGVFHLLKQEIRKRIDKSTDVLPTSISRNLYSGRDKDGNCIIPKMHDLYEELRVTASVEQQLEYWHEKAQVQLSNYILIEGELYKRSSEPIYAISEGIEIIKFDENIDHSDSGIISTFAATDFQECINEYEKYKENRSIAGIRDRKVYIDVFEPSMVTWPAEDMDFDRVARRLERYISIDIARLSSNCTHIDIPKDIYVSWLDLRDLLKTYVAIKDGVPSELPKIVFKAAECWTDFTNNPALGNRFIQFPNMEEIEKAHARWLDKTINIDWSAGGVPQATNGL